MSEPTVGKLLNDLRHFVEELALTEAVVEALLPGGVPHGFETELWDYKEKAPSLPDRPKDEDRKRFTAELGDIMKDVVSFHNAYGGYIVFGVSDKGRDRVRGCDAEFDIGDFNKRLHSYTDVSIQCLYRRVPAYSKQGDLTVGILLVPRRASGVRPIKFRKDGPEKPNGSRAFQKETYVRIRDECRPATATSEDWQFLHSDRTPPDSRPSGTRHQVRTLLPARDPDLVEFVGREGPLSELRRWLSDSRSPVRLITGIGGLGKTALAYRFAEEVASTGAGELEWVIWLTAKQQTYSALRGRMVASSKVDFVGLPSLYQAILRALSYEFPLEAEEPSPDEMLDRVVEALSVYSCLIIVDDIDTLQPDEQRETVAALNGMALRTVGRDMSPSRVLMTSRIDHGLPATAVVKISGLDQPAFDRHIANLARKFSVATISETALESFYEATSGSPLFAASILRLVSLGESLRDVVETWRGQEGEDVRKFAFEREIKRLDTAQARLLYAVLLLGETSVNDLASVLEVTPKVVRDRISELQAYHLIATAIKETGDVSIFAPSDLAAVVELLRVHLGPSGKTVESACAKAQERSGSDIRSLGLGIRNVLGAWDAGRYSEAVIIAEGLRQKFPKQGDVSSILGAALLRTSPPRLKEADRALEEALRLGCSRPELLPNIVKVKSELREWQALYDVVRPLTSNERTRDTPLSAFLLAVRNLILIAKERGDDERAAELAIEAVERIRGKMARQRLEPQFFAALSSYQFDFAREYVRALDRLSPRSGDKLRVFEGVIRLAEADVILADLLKGGFSALQAWWRDVEGRPIVDTIAASLLGKQLRRLERVRTQLQSYGTPAELAEELDRVVRDLAFRGAQLSTSA